MKHYMTTFLSCYKNTHSLTARTLKGTTHLKGLIMAARRETTVLKFGIIADIQYADADDGYNHHRTSKRYYRGSLDMLRKALDIWGNDTVRETDFILQLGDIIDGCNKRLDISESSLMTVLGQFSVFRNPVYHIWGNHEYYNFTTEYLLKSSLYSGKQKFTTPVENKTFYRCEPHPQLRILALNCYEVSLLASPQGSAEYKKALQYLENNPNEELNAPEGLEGVDRRFLKFNGAVSDDQLSWLEQNLKEAREKKQNVIIMGHCGVYPDSTDHTCLCWNYQEILEILQSYSDCVMCYLSGHDHQGGNATDESGILHFTFPGVLENNRESDFATAFLSSVRLEIIGNGRVPSFSLKLRFPLDSEE